MNFVHGEKRRLGFGFNHEDAQTTYQDARQAENISKRKRRRRFFHASGGHSSALSSNTKEEFEEYQCDSVEEGGEVQEGESVAPLNALEVRDVVVSDLVQKGWALSAHCRQKRAGKTEGVGFKEEERNEGKRNTSRLRAAREASFVSIPTGQSSGSAELLEQMSQFEPNTRQRLLIFGLERMSEEVFTPNRHMWQDHSHELGVLLHLHPARHLHRSRLHSASETQSNAKVGTSGSSTESSQQKQYEKEPKPPQPKHERRNQVLSTSPFFLSPGDFSTESVARVDRARLEQCAFYGQNFSNFHCGSFVEVLSGDFNFDEQLPPLALESSVTDEAVGQHISTQREKLRARAFRVPLTVRLSQKSGWVYIRSRDKVKAEVELRGKSLNLFVGLWLTLERLWHVQHSTRHPHQHLRKEATQNLELTRPPAAPISVHVIESRDQLSVIRREFFFVLRPLKHLWARYLCELSRFVSTFTKRNKVWADFEKQALCLSVVIPSTDDGSW